MDLDIREQNDGTIQDPLVPVLGEMLQAQEGLHSSEQIQLLEGEEEEDKQEAPSLSLPIAPAAPLEEAEINPVEAANRKRRRQQWENDQKLKLRWDMQKRLVEVSTDVELLVSEVAKIRSELHVPLPPLSALPHFELQTLESAHKKRLEEILSGACRKTLQSIMQHKWSWPFNSPVNLDVYKDYLEKVEKPMDFGSIKKKLESKEYAHPDAFRNDVRLVFENAKNYNKPGSDVHVMAVTLGEKFEEKYRSAVQSKVNEETSTAEAEAMAARRRYASNNKGTTTGGDTVSAAPSTKEAAEARVALLIKYLDQVATNIADAKSATAALCAPVSQSEKANLAKALGTLSQPHFEAAVSIVMHHHPGLQPFDEVAFDLDMLDALTLRQLISFVQSIDSSSHAPVQQHLRQEDENEKNDGTEDDEKDDIVRKQSSFQWPAVVVGSGLKTFVGRKKRRGASVTPTQQHMNDDDGIGDDDTRNRASTAIKSDDDSDGEVDEDDGGVIGGKITSAPTTTETTPALEEEGGGGEEER